jgi:hypothetical protein
MMRGILKIFVPYEEKFLRRRKAEVMFGWDEELLG